MKKRMLPMILVCSVMLCQPVMAMEQGERTPVRISESGGIMPFASDYIVNFEGDIENLGRGKIGMVASMKAYDTDKLEIKAQVQNNADGTWKNYGAATTVSDAKNSIAMDKEKAVPDGKYRIKFTYNAYVGSKVVETRALTTGSVTVKK